MTEKELKDLYKKNLVLLYGATTLDDYVPSLIKERDIDMIVSRMIESHWNKWDNIAHFQHSAFSSAKRN
jgi:hypothetical protein